MLSRFARLAASIGHARARHLVVACGLIIGLALAGSMSWLIDDLRADHLEHARQHLGNLAIVVAEELDWSVQGIDLLQLELIDHMRLIGVEFARSPSIGCCRRSRRTTTWHGASLNCRT